MLANKKVLLLEELLADIKLRCGWETAALVKRAHAQEVRERFSVDMQKLAPGLVPP